MLPDAIIFSGVQPSASPSMSLLLLRLAHDPEIGNCLVSFVPQRQGEFSGVSATVGLSFTYTTADAHTSFVPQVMT